MGRDSKNHTPTLDIEPKKPGRGSLYLAVIRMTIMLIFTATPLLHFSVLRSRGQALLPAPL